MEKQKEIIITERGVYKKVNDNGRIIIPHHKRAENKNENEVKRKLEQELDKFILVKHY